MRRGVWPTAIGEFLERNSPPNFSSSTAPTFLHCTVRDFVQSEDAQDMLRKRIKTMFSPNISLFKAFFAQIKSILMKPEYLANSGPLADLVNDMVLYARDSEFQHGVARSQLLDEVTRVVRVHEKCYGHAFFKTVQRSCPGFLGFAAERGLELYLAEKLPQRLQRLPTTDSKLSTFLLCHALVSKDAPCQSMRTVFTIE